MIRKGKHIAAEHDMSVSAWIKKVAADEVRKEERTEALRRNLEYEQAKAVVFKAMGKAVDYGDGDKTFNRDDLHER